METIKCTFIDPDTHQECETWYPYEEGFNLCPEHRKPCKPEEVVHISRTCNGLSNREIDNLNAAVAKCLEMSHADLVAHIQNIEAQIRELERERRAANIAKRNIEDRLSDEEREALRKESQSYVVKDPSPKKAARKKSPEERARSRKEGFSAWAARLGLKTEELMVMDDEEMSSRIAKYKAQKG